MEHEQVVINQSGDWACLCGNRLLDDGFCPCNEAGEPVDSGAEQAYSRLRCCERCGRVIDVYHGHIIGWRRKIEINQNGEPICPCGQSTEAGLYCSDSEGVPIEAPRTAPGSKHFTCGRCGRIMALGQGEYFVTGWSQPQVPVIPGKKSIKVKLGLDIFGGAVIECLCGSTSEGNRFYHCDRQGKRLEESEYSCCDQCGRIIQNETLEVVSVREENTPTAQGQVS